MESIWESKAIEEKLLHDALHLIKLHIGSAYTQQDHDLHEAVQKIVTVARRHSLLEA